MTAHARGTRRKPRPRVAAGLVAAAAVLTLLAIGRGVVAYRTAAADLPPLPEPASIATSTVVLDRDGRLLRPFTTADGRWRLPVTSAGVDPRFLDMLIAYEDRRFKSHGGVDLRALVRAAGQFLLAGGRIVSGGSTLTMQVARLIDGGPTRSIGGKLRQIAMARALERRFSKEEILDLYLTLAPYGGNIEGIRSASLAYFGKEPRRLTTAEAALLVALPQSPEARRPDRNADAARAARDRVLDRVTVAGAITAEAAEAAKTERVPGARRDFPMRAAHLAQRSVASHPNQPVHHLTLDGALQASLEALAHQRIATLGARLSMAIVVADHRSGAVLASVGSAGLFEDARDGHVDMTRAVRSPGSALKPLIYGLAFEAGLAHPESLIEDRPTGFGAYVPQNFDGFHRGTVTVREALTQSLNIPAIVALDEVGPARLVARLKRAAVDAELPEQSTPGLAIGLGGVGTSLRDLVAIYGAIASGGAAIALNDGVDTGRGGSGSPVLSPTAAWYVADILSDTVPPENGAIGRVAYKTGTSYGYRDAWAIGFDGAHVAGVWVGRPDGTPVPGLSGFTTAAPILFEAFDRIGLRRAPLGPAPAGALVASTGTLPAPLRRFRVAGEAAFEQRDTPEIAFPLDGVAVDLGIGAGDAMPLVIKVRNGKPPFTFFANGVPIGREPFARSESWQPDGPGFVTLSVVDANGKADRVSVFVE